MAPPSVVKPGGRGLSKTPLFATIGAQLVSKCCCDCNDQVWTMKIVNKAKKKGKEDPTHVNWLQDAA